MKVFDLTDIEFKIDINDIYNQHSGYQSYRSKELMVMVKFNEERRENFKSVANLDAQQLSFVGKECLLQGEFDVKDCNVRLGKMGKVVTLHLESQGYTLVHGQNAVRKFFIDNVLTDMSTNDDA